MPTWKNEVAGVHLMKFVFSKYYFVVFGYCFLSSLLLSSSNHKRTITLTDLLDDKL